MTQQRYHMSHISGTACGALQAPRFTHSLCNRERLQQKKKQMRKQVRLPPACFYFSQSKLKQLLPTGALELIQPIFAAACRAFKETNLAHFFPYFRRAYLTDRKPLSLSPSTEAPLCSGETAARCSDQTAGVTPRVGETPAITSAVSWVF